MRFFRFQKSHNQYQKCLEHLKYTRLYNEKTWQYIENTFKQITSSTEIENFINAYHEVFGIDHRFLHTTIDINDRTDCDYADLRYMGNIIHIAYAAKNESALQYIFGHFNQPKLFEIVEKTPSITAIDPGADVLPQQLLPKYQRISYSMGFHQRLGANSILLATANHPQGQQAFTKDLTKEIFSYLSMRN